MFDSSLLHPSEKRHVTWFATLDGAIASFLPLSEKKYRRLFMLHNKLVTAVPHVGGLNPKKFRLVLRGSILYSLLIHVLIFIVLIQFLKTLQNQIMKNI